ncbi:MAG: hypothetical protein O6931_09030 [Gammaproteobacteria bacterium]|nr:hypothetical protein [Gammaproteobacteria bacterium]
MSFFSELKRRNVFRVGFAYLITAWLVAQIADLSRLLVAAMLGDSGQANELAGTMDARLAGPFSLSVAVYQCLCGAPFDIDSTPNFKARIEEAGFPWPPPTRIHYPAKDW